jgi:uncharacterized RDD family membrane protein YckC
MMSATSPAEAVVFAKADHASFWARFLAGTIDLVVTLTAWLLLVLGTSRLLGSASLVTIAATGIVVWSLYSVVLKYNGSSTLGYLLLGLKVLNYAGARPKLWAIVVRSLLGLFSPVNLVIDGMWLSGDPQRQALRDKVVGTYVIKGAARPTGRGVISYVAIFGMGISVFGAEVLSLELSNEDRANALD